MKIWRSAGHPGWLGVLIGEFSAYSYVAVLAIGTGAAMARTRPPDPDIGLKILLTSIAIGVVSYCFPKYRWLVLFGTMVTLVTFLTMGLLDPRNTYVDRVGIGFIVAVELLFMFARWRAGAGIA